MYWRDKIYVELALPFGGASAPNIFNRSVDLLYWIFCDNSIHITEDDIDRYHDDFFSCGPPNSDQCLNGLNDCLELAKELAVEIEQLKTFSYNSFALFRLHS